MRYGVGLIACLVFASCSCEPTGYDSRLYACTSDADCAAGFGCVEGICRERGVGGGSGGAGGGGALGGGGGGGTGGGGADLDASVPCESRPEICGDLVDDNCNQILDDGCECDAGRPCWPVDGVFGIDLSAPQLRYPWDGGAGCSAGVQACESGQLAQTCVGVHTPGAEYCDGKDTNCDGVVNFGCPCQNGRDCYPGAPFTNGVGVCRAGTFDCTQPAGQSCVNVNLGGVETCNGLDDDCNGAVDDNLTGTSPCASGVCSSRMKSCVDGGEPACDLTAIPGYSATELCGNQLDDNCNGAVDEGCLCTQGSMQSCFTGPSGTCDGGSCLGVCRLGAQACGTLSDGGLGFGACTGQVLPGSEATLCADSLDNDCDGLTDCADSQCDGRACGGGRTCSGGQCRCVGPDGGVSTVEICTDGVDNTCDQLTDCAQSTCDGQACGANGKRCLGGACSCLKPDGGVASASESPLCGDGLDNDCDGLIDCADSNCGNVACATGRTCQQSVCTCLGPDGGTPQTVETLCGDGVDNDCDGLKDCLDPSCATKACAAGGTSFCCATSCVDLTSDSRNCGQCGYTCPSGVCQRVTESTRTVGRCGCAVDGGTGAGDCPSGSQTPQTCSTTARMCTCNDDDDACDSNRGGKCGDRACYYP